MITSGFDAQRVDSTSNDQPGSALPTETLQEIEDRGQGSIPWVWKMALGERPGNKAVFFFHVVLRRLLLLSLHDNRSCFDLVHYWDVP